jgi:hypothetical protein
MLMQYRFSSQHLSLNLNQRPFQLMILLMTRCRLGLMMIASTALMMTSRHSPHQSRSEGVYLTMTVFRHSLPMMHQKVGRLALKKNPHATILSGHVTGVADGYGG